MQEATADTEAMAPHLIRLHLIRPHLIRPQLIRPQLIRPQLIRPRLIRPHLMATATLLLIQPPIITDEQQIRMCDVTVERSGDPQTKSVKFMRLMQKSLSH